MNPECKHPQLRKPLLRDFYTAYTLLNPEFPQAADNRAFSAAIKEYGSPEPDTMSLNHRIATQPEIRGLSIENKPHNADDGADRYPGG